MNGIYRIYHPEVFQGKHKGNTDYFEGWYFKLIDPSCAAPLAVIAGISFQKDGKDNHAFIQVLDAASHQASYLRFPQEEFGFCQREFEITIGRNRFFQKGLTLDLPLPGGPMTGTLGFVNEVTFPKTLTRPGIMGPYSFIPGMECYHGVIHMHHEIKGTLAYGGKEIDYDGGYGYIEKDWGRSFPKAWIWMQSNHFKEKEISFMFSYGEIPWRGKSFMGLISFLRIGEDMYTFATYTGAKLERLAKEGRMLHIQISDKKGTLFIQGELLEGGILKAPRNGRMSEEIRESIKSIVTVRFLGRDGQEVYQGTGTHTGIEISSGMEQRL